MKEREIASVERGTPRLPTGGREQSDFVLVPDQPPQNAIPTQET